MLTNEQIEAYRDEGYLLVREVFDAATVAELKSVTDAFVARSVEVESSNETYDIGVGHCPERPVVRRLKHPHLLHDVYDRVVRAPALVDIVSALLGENVRFDHSKLNFKPRRGAAAIEWHQDWAFYPHTNDDILAVGVLIEDCKLDNGPMMVLPGSHRGPIYDHHHDGVFVGAMDPNRDRLDASDAVDLTGKAGDITVHHVRTLHGSRENLSDSDRPLLVISYAAVDAWPVGQSVDLAEFDDRILRGSPTVSARQLTLPVRMPYPKIASSDSIFDDQDAVRGRSFQ